MKKFLFFTALICGISMAAIPTRAHADIVFSYGDLLASDDGWPYGDNVYITNTYNVAVDVNPYVSTYNNVTWSLYDVTIEPGSTVLCGWVANTANREAWEFRLGYTWAEHSGYYNYY
jgi:hypothetical protein